jgi:hypothetical protein
LHLALFEQPGKDGLFTIHLAKWRKI